MPFVSAEEACRQLRVKRATLYTYVSRGLIRCVGAPGPDGKRYDAHDVARVAARSAARRGHGAVAAGALRWGEPVLDSAITRAGEDGLCYRGRDVVALARGSSFEEVCALLWGAGDDARAPWEVPGPLPQGPGGFLDRCFAIVRALSPSAHEAPRAVDPATERARTRSLLAAFVQALPGPGLGAGAPAGSFGGRVAGALGVPQAARWCDAALILCADHELNVSTFTARVAASAGADLYACLTAALCTFTGPKHGTACARIEIFLDSLPARGLGRSLKARAARGEGFPGFGHPLYPLRGDPRARALLALVREGPQSTAGRAALDLVALVESETGQAPTIDAALVVLRRQLGLPPEAAAALFALGRVAGWAAHVFEQREAGFLLRPRARYTGL